jgi:protoporphyrinogen oxidase
MDLIVGAGISGLGYANFCGHDDFLIIDRDSEVGGYCKTVKQDGFVWDYSGHFFHFSDPSIRRYFLSRMEGTEIYEVIKRTKIRFKGKDIDFPFQKNIHQLEKEDFADCVYHLFFREQSNYSTFKEMLFANYGKGISERFLIPYNEKLYACDLDLLDNEAMGRFFPHADIEEIIRNFKQSNNTSYNASFLYPKNGAFEFVNALRSGIDNEKISLNEVLLHVNTVNREATTNKRVIRFDRIISSIPFPKLLDIIGIEYSREIYTWNKVLVFNLGFDSRCNLDEHWIYFPEKDFCFYRVGFYNNILGGDRMSLYVELGFKRDAEVDVDYWLKHVMEDLAKANIIASHRLVSKHSIILDPAYVHINKACQDDVTTKKDMLKNYGIISTGRYGSWTYCSMEDNIIEVKEHIAAMKSSS